MKYADKPHWRTRHILRDHKGLEEYLNTTAAPKDYWLHAIVYAAGGYTIIYTKIPAQVLFDRREEARKRRKAGR